MASRSGRLVRLAGSAVVAMAVLAGCASAPAPATRPEEVVRERAQARWDAVAKEDYTAAYAYLSPGSRSVNSLDAYRTAVPKGFYKGGKVESVSCNEADKCEVQVRVEYEFKGGRIKTPLAETWIRQEGNWWYVLK